MTPQDSREALAQRLRETLEAWFDQTGIGHWAHFEDEDVPLLADAILADGSRFLPPSVRTIAAKHGLAVAEDGREVDWLTRPSMDEDAPSAPTADAVEALATAHRAMGYLGDLSHLPRVLANLPSGWSLRGPEDAALVEIGRAVTRLPDRVLIEREGRSYWHVILSPDTTPDGDVHPAIEGEGSTLPEAVDRALAGERADVSWRTRSEQEAVADPDRVTWTCTVTGPLVDLPSAADFPMRRAVEAAYRGVTGNDPDDLWSGWNGAARRASERAAGEEET